MLEKEQLEQFWNQIETLNTDKIVSFVKEQNVDQQEKFQLFSMIQRKFYDLHAQSITLEDYGQFILDIVDTYKAEASLFEEPNTLLHFANVMLYNLSADMAECWAEESYVKTSGCFEIGLKAALDCLHLRVQLQKDDASFAMAYWAVGMHQLSLHRNEESLESFKTAFNYSVNSSNVASVFELTAENSFSDILYAGYLGIASVVNELAEGEKIYDFAIKLFEQQIIDDEKKKGDAAFGIKQLEHVRNKFIQLSVK
jgi:hypothetical protein